MGVIFRPTTQGSGRSLSHSEAAGLGAAGLSRHHRALIALSVTSGLLLVIFGLTMAPDLTWANDAQDGGELITAAVTLGIPHPPGYPTYVLLGKLFSLLPIGTVAFRLNLMSAVTVALAAGLVAALLSRRTATSSGVVVAIASGVLIGLLPPVWRQATAAEVYGLNLVLVTALVFCLITGQRAFVTGIFLGLAITAHLSSLLLVPMAIALTPRPRWGALALGTAAGLAPLLLLPWMAQYGSPVVWGAPQTPVGWWWLVSARLYTTNLSWPAPDHFWGLARPYLWLAPLLLLLGLVVPVLPARQPHRPATSDRLIGLTIAAYATLALLYQTPDAHVILLPALMLAAVLVLSRLALSPSVMLVLPAILLVTGFNAHNLRQDTPVRPLAEAVLQAAPADAILLAPGDRTIFTLWYFHHAEGQRPDLVLVDTNLMAFDWYRDSLARRYPALRGLEHDDLARFRLLNGSHAPLCEVGLVSPAQPPVPGYTHRLGAEGHAPFLLCQELTS